MDYLSGTQGAPAPRVPGSRRSSHITLPNGMQLPVGVLQPVIEAEVRRLSQNRGSGLEPWLNRAESGELPSLDRIRPAPGALAPLAQPPATRPASAARPITSPGGAGAPPTEPMIPENQGRLDGPGVRPRSVVGPEDTPGTRRPASLAEAASHPPGIGGPPDNVAGRGRGPSYRADDPRGLGRTAGPRRS